METAISGAQSTLPIQSQKPHHYATQFCKDSELKLLPFLVSLIPLFPFPPSSPPSSQFPARSLVKRPVISSCTFLSSQSETTPPIAKTPFREGQNHSLSNPISPSVRPRYLLYKESKSSVKRSCVSQAHARYNPSHYSPSPMLTSTAAEIHPHRYVK